MEVFKCRNEESCPGGSPQTCAEGWVGINCGQCAADAALSAPARHASPSSSASCGSSATRGFRDGDGAR